MIFKIILILTFWSLNTHAIETLDAKSCQKKQIVIDKTPFAIDVFCEDALGKYIGIVYRGIMAGVSDQGWAIEERYWQEKSWSRDVVSFEIIDKGNSLLVSTSDIYGEAGIYLLRLKEKKSKKIYTPKKEESFLTIKNFDEKSRKLKFTNDKELVEIVVEK